jgi:hypothetical protein
MSDNSLHRLRELRLKAESLSNTLVDDYRPFRSPFDKTTFFRLPTKPSKKASEIGVTPTCTAFMTLALTNSLGAVYCPQDEHDVAKVFSRIWKHDDIRYKKEFGLGSADVHEIVKSGVVSLLKAPWDTGKLDANNAFTSSLVLRSTGLLRHVGVLRDADITGMKRKRSDHKKAEDYRQFNGKTLKEIVNVVAQKFPDSLAVGGYPPTPSIVFWFCDSISLLGFDLTASQWEKIVKWAVVALTHQVSLVQANHQAMMDPVAMAMAACLCHLLRRMARKRTELAKALSKGFPTDIELTYAVKLFFLKQNDAGVWDKYFPLFHYPGAGPNHCWHFEVAEAVFQEFPEIVSDPLVVEKVELLLTWLEQNRLHWQTDTNEFNGWNAGGDIKSLQRGEPESWPTGVAHMALWRLREALSSQIQEMVLREYRGRVQLFGKPSTDTWDTFLDCRLPLKAPRNSVKALIEFEILTPASDSVAEYERSAERCGNTLGAHFRLKGRRSALLFGPPGTSKTSLAQAIAEKLGWPFIELSPSDFLKEGMDEIYVRVNEVFNDLMDLSGAVILFDEMDALVQSRESGEDADSVVGDVRRAQLDVTQKFLTTSMLPKLQKLRKQGRVIFLMATNHQKDFDPAIKRPGRFDLLVRMGPPSYKEKLRWLKQQCQKASVVASDQTWICSNFKQWTKSVPVKEAIERFTFGEMESLVDFIREKAIDRTLRQGLEDMGQVGLEKEIVDRAKNRITLRDGRTKEFEDDVKEVRIQ